MKVSCIIPAYNEEETIENVIKIVKKIDLIDEIVVVDDGSDDKTYEEVIKNDVKVVKHEKNRGKGGAIKTGIKNSNGDVLFFFDADIKEIDIEKLKEMIKCVKDDKFDVSIGYFDSPYFQTFTEVHYKNLMKLLFPEVIEKIPKGHLSGQRVFKRKIIEMLELKDGFDLELSMNMGVTFLERDVKINFVNLGEIKVKPKGYQKGMEVIGKSIIDYSKKYKRFGRIKESSFDKAVNSLSKIINEVIN